ncbi:hypothetical protein Q7P37_000126 [Cladosporium fusiforme]
MASSAANAKRTRGEFEETFVVLVGTEDCHKRFIVHHDAIVQRSDFFKAARSVQWKTDPLKPVCLEDDDPEVFTTYLNCVYFNKVMLPGSNQPAFKKPNENVPKRWDRSFEALVATYILADKLLDHVTTDLVSDEVLRHSTVTSSIPSAKTVALAYQSTTENAPLRQLLRDICAHHANSLPQSGHPWPAEFLEDLVGQLFAHKAGKIPGTSVTRARSEQGLYHQSSAYLEACSDVLHLL